MSKTDDVVEDIVKKKPRGKNIGDTLAPVVEPGDNAKYLAVSIKLMNLPDIDLHDVEQVQARLTEYFQIHADNDLKPTVAGMGLALNGMDRRRLWEIRTGNDKAYDLPTAVSDTIKRAYKLMENLWENYMQNGKINPVSGIFLGKNNFGYADKQEVVLTPNNPLGEQKSTDELEQRYLDSVADEILTE